MSSVGGRLRLAPTLAATLLLGGCEPEPLLSSPPSMPSVIFRDATEEARLIHRSESFDAAAGDVDGDGRLDIYLANHGAEALLVETTPDGAWQNRSPGSGVDPSGDQHGTALGDYDADGDLDLYVSLGAARGRARKANRLYRNRGDGTFEDVARTLGVEDPDGRSRAVAWLDVDLDGRLDLLVGNYATPARLYRGAPDGTFTDVTPMLGLPAPAPLFAWADYDRDGRPDLLIRARDGLRLLRNESGGFVDRTKESGLGPDGEQVGALGFADANGDGRLDLYLGFGTQYVDGVVAADGEIRFAFFASTEPKGFDFDSGGEAPDFDLFHNGHAVATDDVANAARREEEGFATWKDAEGWHLRWYGEGDHHLSGVVRGARNPKPIGLDTWRPGGGALWLGREDGSFERAPAQGLRHDANVQQVIWEDFDNDGWVDLYVVDGGIEGAGRPNILFLNREGRAFVRASDPAAFGTPPASGERHSAAQAIDYDSDGRLDLLLLAGLGIRPFQAGPYQLLHNESPAAHWIDVQLIGESSNRGGLGTWVEVDACGRTRTRYHDGHRGPFSQSALPIHFGLGSCAKVDSIRLRWPSGTKQAVEGPKVDQRHEIRETR